MHLLKGTVLLVLRPAAFIRDATAHAIATEMRENEQLRAKFPEGPIPENIRLDLESTVRNQTASIRRALGKGLGITLLTIAVGFAAGLGLKALFGVPSKGLVYFMQAAGAAVILGATLGEVGREITTWDRRSLPERINSFLFHALYVVGTFIFVASVTWDAT